jgi:DNA-directed RNA polymerase subunit beta'
MPSRIGLMLDMSSRQLERVSITRITSSSIQGQTPLQKAQLLTEAEYREAQDQYGETFRCRHGCGRNPHAPVAGRSRELNKELEEAMTTTRSKQIRKKLAKRLKLVQGFASSHTRPEWMILECCR